MEKNLRNDLRASWCRLKREWSEKAGIGGWQPVRHQGRKAKEGPRSRDTEYRLTNHLPGPVSCPSRNFCCAQMRVGGWNFC